jgi:glycosidase
MDTVKYVDPTCIETFGNAMREFALSIGKKNFFTFGEVYDDEATISRFIGRHGAADDGYGIDAALDFPLFYKLPGIAKGWNDVSELRGVFEERKRREAGLLSSHGEAGRYFVSFVDNHDQQQRIKHPLTPEAQATLALGLMFTLQGIPALYYGTEQGLSGTVDSEGNPDLTANESCREALWGKPGAFDTASPMFQHVKQLAALRLSEPPLVYGRLYFREVSGNGIDFGHSAGAGGIVAFSRILSDREVLVIANTGAQEFAGAVIVDRDINAEPRAMSVAYSNLGATGSSMTQLATVKFYGDRDISEGLAATLAIRLAAREVQVLTPA